MSDLKPQPHVLFVDDEPDFLRVVTDTFHGLSEGRWHMHRANSASAALEILKKEKMDLVVVDVNMPLLDGVQLLRILSRRHPDLKKVTLTGYATEAKRSECLANGSELFLEKPRTEQGLKSIFLMLEELLTWTPKQGFQGMLRQVGLNNVIQMECLGRNSSILEIQNRQLKGRIFIEDGSIIHAVVGEEQGEKAFQQLLSISGGEFKLQPFEKPPVRTIEGSWEFLLMEAARVRDEMASQAAAPDGAGTGDAEAETEPDVTVTETLISSLQGETIYAWQCEDVSARIALMQAISQQAGLLSRSLPLGSFDRLEVFRPHEHIITLAGKDRMLFARIFATLAHPV